ncbi:MAG: hypothetical protein ACYCZR_12410 [Burkholderiales bacterium]
MCGNNDMFVEACKVWDKVYYGGTNDIQDTKIVTVEDTDDPRECGECGSTDIDEVGTARMTLTGL